MKFETTKSYPRGGVELTVLLMHLEVREEVWVEDKYLAVSSVEILLEA